ncbi:MAG TPA: histidine--tRNA ligase [Actinomycetota bacterium]|nr:histidine--tRNA ligase [Actinomycetota bacterium]
MAGAAGRGARLTDFQPPRGTQDLLPPSSDALEALAADAATLARRFGFRRVETPAFEHTELFTRGVGEASDIVTKEMYTFEDKGGRSLTLRPEGTAPVVRSFLANRQRLPVPFKAYYVVPMFRHERPQAGRMRQHTQFGVEIIGSGSPLADVEVVTVGFRYLAGRGLSRLALHLNSIGDENCRPAYREVLIAFLKGRVDQLCQDSKERMLSNPLRVLDCKVEGCRKATEDAPRILDFLDDACREHFESVKEGLDEEGIPYVLDHRLVRGLDYYTRTAFELVSDVLGPTQSTLCGGGRYDGLAEVLGGEPTPGIGFGLGLERLLLAMEREGLRLPALEPLAVFLVALGEAAAKEARALLRALREQGVAADASLEDRPLKAQLKMADRTGARYAAILGEQELAEGLITVRRMADGHQERVKLSEVGSWLTR